MIAKIEHSFSSSGGERWGNAFSLGTVLIPHIYGG